MGGRVRGHLSSLPGASGPVVPTPSRARHTRACACSSVLPTLCSPRQRVPPGDPRRQHLSVRGQPRCDPRPGPDPDEPTRIRETDGCAVCRRLCVRTCGRTCICVCVCSRTCLAVCPPHLPVRRVDLRFYCTCACVCVCAHACSYLYVCTCVFQCVYLCHCIVCTGVCLCMSVCTSVYVCVSICESVWTRALGTPPVGGIWPRDVFGLALTIFSTS